MAVASQVGTYTTGTSFTGALHTSELAEIYTNLNSITNAQINASAAINFSKMEQVAWTSFTPTWHGTGSDPAIGNGTYTGVYQKIGRVVNFALRVLCGSTTTYGSGGYSVDLPVTAATGNGVLYTCTGYLVIGATLYGLRPIVGTTTVTLYVEAANSTYVSFTVAQPTIPTTFANATYFIISGSYEAAS